MKKRIILGITALVFFLLGARVYTLLPENYNPPSISLATPTPTKHILDTTTEDGVTCEMYQMSNSSVQQSNCYQVKN